MFAFLGHAIFIPYLAMVIMGVAYSLLACALWPLVAFVIPEHQLGTAYGMYVRSQGSPVCVLMETGVPPYSTDNVLTLTPPSPPSLPPPFTPPSLPHPSLPHPSLPLPLPPSSSMQAIQNLGLAVFSIIAGVLVDNNGYLTLEVFFIANLCIALIAGKWTLLKVLY